MQKFGIEIRKAGTRSGLYADVDKVLSEIGMGNGGVSKVMQVQTVAHSLQNMLKAKDTLMFVRLEIVQVSVTYVFLLSEWIFIGQLIV